LREARLQKPQRRKGAKRPVMPWRLCVFAVLSNQALRASGSSHDRGKRNWGQIRGTLRGAQLNKPPRRKGAKASPAPLRLCVFAVLPDRRCAPTLLRMAGVHLQAMTIWGRRYVWYFARNIHDRTHIP
jgi:hypothetical protein